MKLRTILLLAALLGVVVWAGVYDYLPPGLTYLDPSRPLGSESVSLGAPAIRQIKAALIAFATAEHNLDGTHKAGVIQTAYLADGAVTLTKLSPLLQGALLASGALTNIGNIPAYLLASSTNAGPQIAWNGTLQTIATLSVPSNGMANLLISADVQVYHYGGSTLSALNQISVGTNVAVSATNSAPDNVTTFFTISGQTAGGQMINTTVNVQIVPPAYNSTWRVNTFKIWGIP